MNYFKSFLLTAFALVALTACDTDDLRDDIDDLKGRVESLEAQILLLNDNMTAIRRLMEGGQTITEITENNGTYTLKLSGGETVTLTQGSTGEIRYPEITVNDKGQWVVNGELLTQNGVPVQAVGLPGNDGITPKFRLTDDGGYWQISYDNGTSWENVLNEQGDRVSAINSDTSAGTADTFFEEAGIDNSGDYFVIKLKGQTETISIPIVKDLLCEIVEPTEGMNKGYWEIGYGATATTTVKVKGENILVTAPSGWVATVSEPDAVTNEAILSITAPITGINRTRATADNSSDVTLQVNKGANWAVAKIQVKAIEIIDSYFALYEAGETLTIGGIAVNKETFGEATLVTTGNTEITSGGVYFLDPAVEAEYTGNSGNGQLILIGNSSSAQSTLKVKSQIKLIAAANGPEAFICQNINFDTNGLGNYAIVQNKNGGYGNVIFKDCCLNLEPNKNLTYISTATRSIDNIIVENCTIPLSAEATSNVLIALSTSTATYGSITFRNNVFYCPTEGKFATKMKLINGNKASVQKMTVANNTFVNIYTETTFYVYLASLSTVYVTNNLFYATAVQPNNCGLFRLTEKPNGEECYDNICYKADNTYNWQIFFGGVANNGFAGAEELTTISSDPFEGGTFDLANGIFIPGAEYAGYGASIN